MSLTRKLESLGVTLPAVAGPFRAIVPATRFGTLG
jgi:hypothetical protein